VCAGLCGLFKERFRLILFDNLPWSMKITRLATDDKAASRCVTQIHRHTFFGPSSIIVFEHFLDHSSGQGPDCLVRRIKH